MITYVLSIFSNKSDMLIDRAHFYDPADLVNFIMDVNDHPIAIDCYMKLLCFETKEQS